MFSVSADQLNLKYNDALKNAAKSHKLAVIGVVNSKMNEAIKQNFEEQVRNIYVRDSLKIYITNNVVIHYADRVAAVKSATLDLVAAGFEAHCEVDDENEFVFVEIKLSN